MAARVTYETTAAGVINCDVLGDLKTASTVLLTVHDLGCNSTSWENFVSHPTMVEITSRATWLHVNLPGQEENAPDLPEGSAYPSMETLAEAVGEICNTVTCPVIGVGEGAGANVLARLAISGHKQLYGAILIHCTSTTAGYVESLQDSDINSKLLAGMNPTAENYLVLHRFGDFANAQNATAVQAVVENFRDQLNNKMNSKNIRGYIDSFVHRSNIAEKVADLKTPLLLLTGSKANHNHTVHTLHEALLRSVTDKKLVEFVEIADVANLVEGAPAKLATSLLFFAQGCGVLAGARIPDLTRRPSVQYTMEQLDKSDL